MIEYQKIISDGFMRGWYVKTRFGKIVCRTKKQAKEMLYLYESLQTADSMKDLQEKFNPPKVFPIGICGCQSLSFTLKYRRQNTQYVDDRSNWVKSCKPCFEEIEQYNQERWDEYYASRY